MSNKFSVEFEGFDELMSKLKRLEGDVKKSTEKALQESHKVVTSDLHKVMKSHHLTGETEKSIIDECEINWTGGIAEADVGFRIRNGGIASIFLMRGTPKMSKDPKLYNAVFGRKRQKEIQEIQKNIIFDEIRKLGG